MQLQPPSSAAVGSFLLVFCGYIVVSYALRVAFYQRRRDEAQKWKCQPHKFSSSSSSSSSGHAFAKKGAYHWRFVACNLLTASLFAGLTAEGYARGWWWPETRSQLDEASSPFSIAAREGLLLLLALAWQSICEYWWHRLMHLPWCYRRMHKFHHFYKAPEPFDDMYIHPLEAVGYYCILYCPAAVLPLHPATFFVYMALLGSAGVLDHSGVRVRIPKVYDTRDHDRHHSHVNVNFSFPFPWLDMLHGTYMGSSSSDCGGRSSRRPGRGW